MLFFVLQKSIWNWFSKDLSLNKTMFVAAKGKNAKIILIKQFAGEAKEAMKNKLMNKNGEQWAARWSRESDI